jgi:hypothetical protein
MKDGRLEAKPETEARCRHGEDHRSDGHEPESRELEWQELEAGELESQELESRELESRSCPVPVRARLGGGSRLTGCSVSATGRALHTDVISLVA